MKLIFLGMTYSALKYVYQKNFEQFDETLVNF